MASIVDDIKSMGPSVLVQKSLKVFRELIPWQRILLCFQLEDVDIKAKPLIKNRFKTIDLMEL